MTRSNDLGPRNEREQKIANYSRIGCGVAVVAVIASVAIFGLPETPTMYDETSVEGLTDEQLASRIASGAVSSYSQADRPTYPKLFDKLGGRISEVEPLGKKAAILALRNGQCDRVVYVDVSDLSTKRDLQFFVDCANETRVRVSESEIAKGAVSNVETKASRMSRVASVMARDEKLIDDAKLRVRASLRDPGSADFGRVQVSEKSGLMVCGFVNARNGFGGMSGQQSFIVSADRVMFEGEGGFASRWNKHCATER